METIQWKVDGMTCANCALTIRKYLENQGQQNVKVNPIDGDVSFEFVDNTVPDKLKKGIQGLGYTVKGDASSPAIKKPTFSPITFSASCSACHLRLF